MIVDILHNVRVSVGGASRSFRAGVRDIPDEFAEALIMGGLAVLAGAVPVDEPVDEQDGQEFELEDLSVADLKGIAKDMEIKGYGSMKKDDLIDAIRAQADGE